MLLNSARNSTLSHPLRKLLMAREREIQEMRFELGLKQTPLDLDK